MGQRSQTETIAGIYQAFLQKHTWRQAELARELGVGREALRRILVELQEKGMPLVRDDDPPQVYWSVPKHWYPGAVLFKQEEVPDLLRQLRRVPQGPGRKKVLAIVLSRLPGSEGATPAVVSHEESAQEEQYLSVVEDSASRRVALAFRYYTASSGHISDRHASVHRVLMGPPVRFIATCHRSGTLKTFRVDSIMSARLDEREAYRTASEAALDTFQKESLDGFHGGGEPQAFSFVVRDPDARWVKNNLLAGMQAEPIAGGIRVTANTTALRRLAQFVVSLGEAATPETPTLASEIARLARGALAGAEQPPSRV